MQCIYVHVSYIYIYNPCTPHVDIYHTKTHIHVLILLDAKFNAKKDLVSLPELYRLCKT